MITLNVNFKFQAPKTYTFDQMEGPHGAAEAMNQLTLSGVEFTATES